jgi:hypothetical protein
MQYSDYISQHQSRIDREQQLVNQYNQKPEGQRVQNLWMVGMEKSKHPVSAGDLFWSFIAMVFVFGIIYLSIAL